MPIPATSIDVVAETPASPPTSYADHVAEIIAAFTARKAEGKTFSPDDLVEPLIPGKAENAKVRAVAAALGVPPGDFDKAMRNLNIRNVLGFVPASAMPYVKAMVQKRRITARYNGTLSRDEEGIFDYRPSDDFAPLSRAAAEADRIPITDDVRKWGGDQIATWEKIKSKGSINLSEFVLDLRVLASELKLGIGRDEIGDAVAAWHADARSTRLFELVTHINAYERDLRVAREAAAQSLPALVEASFDTSTMTSAFIESVIRKFIWSVKRKMLGETVPYPLMPVILGKQRSGKSTWVKLFASPIAEASIGVDFGMITDHRNISIWRNFVMVFDEMAWASKSDIDAVKSVITNETLNLRVMRENHTEAVRQCATMIGTANAESLSELIRDPTGTSRFVSLRMLDHPDRDVINAMDWLTLWRSVDINDPDPMEEFRGDLEVLQEADREKTKIEEWLATIEPRFFLGGRLKSNRVISATDLYNEFRTWEDQYAPGAKTTIKAWGTEMSRSIRAERSPFIRRQSNRGAIYEWTGA